MTLKLVYPSASRNCDAIIECLSTILPQGGQEPAPKNGAEKGLETATRRPSILEIASGSGQHISALANRYPDIDWQPSDPEAAARASIDAWRIEDNGANLHAPLDLDVTAEAWWEKVAGPIDGLININMIHISPWQASEGLIRGAGKLLRSGGILYFYGPFKLDDVHTAPSNAAFDASLRSRNASWGVRDQGEVARLAASHGLVLADVIAMPTNNHSLIFRKL